MRTKLLLLPVLLFSSLLLWAQPPAGEERIPERMAQFIRKRMMLTEKEGELFQPIFARYQKEWKETMRKNKEDRLVLQRDLVELQLRYRKEFAPVVGEKRVMEVYDLQEYFIRTLRDIQRERMRGGPGSQRGREMNRRMGPPPPPPGGN